MTGAPRPPPPLQASVIDAGRGDTVRVRFDDSQLGEVEVPLSAARLPPPSPAEPPAPPAEGDQVDVYSRLKDDAPFGWLPAIVKVGARRTDGRWTPAPCRCWRPAAVGAVVWCPVVSWVFIVKKRL